MVRGNKLKYYSPSLWNTYIIQTLKFIARKLKASPNFLNKYKCQKIKKKNQDKVTINKKLLDANVWIITKLFGYIWTASSQNF